MLNHPKDLTRYATPFLLLEELEWTDLLEFTIPSFFTYNLRKSFLSWDLRAEAWKCEMILSQIHYHNFRNSIHFVIEELKNVA